MLNLLIKLFYYVVKFFCSEIFITYTWGHGLRWLADINALQPNREMVSLK
jgi:hypothetical protein